MAVSVCCVYWPVIMTCCSPLWHGWIQSYGTADYIFIIQLAVNYHIPPRKKRLNSMCTCTVNLCYGSRIHIHALAGCFFKGKTVDLPLAMITSWKKSSHATEVFIMLIIHSNQRGTLYPYWRVQSLPARGPSFAGASNKHSKQMLSSNWFKCDAFRLKEKMSDWYE